MIKLNKKQLAISLLCVFAFSIANYHLYFSQEDLSKNISVTAAQNTPISLREKPSIMVHIAGEVKKPGIYTLPLGSRGLDALRHVGGPLKSANLDKVNLAKTLKDGQRLYIPPQKSKKTTKKTASQIKTIKKLSINTASTQALCSIPGIGPAIAKRIILYRQQNGPFKSLDELKEVKGIGAKMLVKIKPYLK